MKEDHEKQTSKQNNKEGRIPFVLLANWQTRAGVRDLFLENVDDRKGI